jgi:hypothetical protein
MSGHMAAARVKANAEAEPAGRRNGCNFYTDVML